MVNIVREQVALHDESSVSGHTANFDRFLQLLYRLHSMCMGMSVVEATTAVSEPVPVAVPPVVASGGAGANSKYEIANAVGTLQGTASSCLLLVLASTCG